LLITRTDAGVLVAPGAVVCGVGAVVAEVACVGAVVAEVAYVGVVVAGVAWLVGAVGAALEQATSTIPARIGPSLTRVNPFTSSPLVVRVPSTCR
jgi:hypothetical protein